MKRLSLLFVIASFAFNTTFIFATQNQKNYESDFITCEKTYVLSDQVYISDEGIFILLQGIWYQTRGIQMDQCGLFFTTIYPENIPWVCPVCGQPNSPHSKICSHCGAERPSRFQ